MFANRMSRIAGAGVLLLLVVGAARAASPWPFKKVTADPKADYWLTENNGPWSVSAASFQGDKAEEQARELVLELRREYQLPAYLFRKRFNLSKGVEGRGVDRYGEPLKMRYNQGNDISEIAVLVGDFSAVDDKQAQKTLQKVKSLRPKSLDREDSAQTHAETRRFFQANVAKEKARAKFGPLAGAFMIPNPLLPKEYFAPKGVDKFVISMNKGVKHSLLNCQGKYTVKVATFSGAILIDQAKIQAVESGQGKIGSRLHDAAEKAHSLTEALREKGVEAYEFHDRYSSIVTVGSFDSLGTTLPDGRIDLSPAIYKIMRQYGADANSVATSGESAKAKKLKNIPFDVSPMPVEVPKQTISGDFARTASRS